MRRKKTHDLARYRKASKERRRQRRREIGREISVHKKERRNGSREQTRQAHVFPARESIKEDVVNESGSRWSGETFQDKRWSWEGERDPDSAHRKKRILIQSMFSLTLVTGIWLLQSSTHPGVLPWKETVLSAFQEDFQFSRVAAWYEQQFEGSPSFLPTFTRNSEKVPVSSTAGQLGFVSLHGQLIRSYSETHQGIQLSLPVGEAVTSVGEGWVIDVSTKEGMGLTVVVQHAQGYQSWYGLLKEASVEIEDWVKPGEAIGSVGESGRYFLAIKHEAAFVDPTRVVNFEE